MAIKLPCPRCKRPLSVPNKKAGGYVQCPQCSGRLWVPKDAPADATHLEEVVAHGGGPPPAPPGNAPSAAASPVVAKTSVPLPPPASSDTLTKVLTPAGAPVAAPPLPAPSLSVAPPSPPPASRYGGAAPRAVPQPPLTPVAVPQHPLPGVAPSGGNGPAAPVAPRTPWQPTPVGPLPAGSPAAAPPVAPPVAPPIAQPQPSGRKVARFISAEAAQSTLKLAADGKLPELHLDEGEQRGKDEKKQRSVNPLLMVIGLGVSVVMSIVLAVSDFGPQSNTRGQSKSEARQLIRDKYYSDLDRTSAVKPYQRLLRDADLAHVRKDFNEERRLYREVLNLLRAEGRAPGEGLTGSPERDGILEQKISILLSDN
jgi:hypothetical protein